MTLVTTILPNGSRQRMICLESEGTNIRNMLYIPVHMQNKDLHIQELTVSTSIRRGHISIRIKLEDQYFSNCFRTKNAIVQIGTSAHKIGVDMQSIIVSLQDTEEVTFVFTDSTNKLIVIISPSKEEPSLGYA